MKRYEMHKPLLIVSLDFELFWGMQDKLRLEQYQDNILGVRVAIPKLLKLFEKHHIHTTWATVGFMFAEGFDDARRFFPSPSLLPSYDNKELSSYRCFDGSKDYSKKSNCFFASSLINEISCVEGQEIGTHTFSHYYCRESGQTKEQFEADLKSAIEIAQEKEYKISSLVFPRNQSVNKYIESLSDLGITVYRDEADDWIHEKIKTNMIKRFFRLLDVYIPLTGQGGYIPQKESNVWNFTGSRMFKPYFKPLFFLEGLKIRRIKRQMLHAAKNNLVFHLWWHPHNIGINTDYHIQQLEEIFSYYDELNSEYKMQSMNMKEAADYYSSMQ